MMAGKLWVGQDRHIVVILPYLHHVCLLVISSNFLSGSVFMFLQACSRSSPTTDAMGATGE